MLRTLDCHSGSVGDYLVFASCSNQSLKERREGRREGEGERGRVGREGEEEGGGRREEEEEKREEGGRGGREGRREGRRVSKERGKGIEG